MTATNSAQKFPQGFMKEDNGSYSSMRLMSFVALISAIVFGSISLVASDSQGNVGINLTYSFLVAAFTPKAVQKFAEDDDKSNPTDAKTRSLTN